MTGRANRQGEALFACLTAAAERHRPCPSVPQMQDVAGCGDIVTAHRRLVDLMRAGRIAVTFERGRRVVIIKATGKSTAPARHSLRPTS